MEPGNYEQYHGEYRFWATVFIFITCVERNRLKMCQWFLNEYKDWGENGQI